MEERAPKTSPPEAFSTAFEKLKQSVNASDAKAFQSTDIKDVWQAARDIERSQRERGSVRNLRRIEPFLQAMEKYSKPIEILCQGTPYLPWLWAPVKLLLQDTKKEQLAQEYSDIFSALVDAYAQIAEALPRFDRFQKAFQGNRDFEDVLGILYAEILEFHRRAYKFFRRRAWHIVFDSLWKDFGRRFNGILERLARYRDLVDKEALSIDIVESRIWRQRINDEIEQKEQQRFNSQRQDVIGWLSADDRLQEDDLDKLSRARQIGTCLWIENVNECIIWMKQGKSSSVLWLNGIPGAGKSILSSYIVSILRERKESTVTYFFCNNHVDIDDQCSLILRSLASQILRQHRELIPHVAENYVYQGYSCSIVYLRRLVSDILATIQSVRIVVDGLDECQEKNQKLVLQELMSFCTANELSCKLLISSRDAMQINKVLKRSPCISLQGRKAEVNHDIGLFVHDHLTRLQGNLNQDFIKDVEKSMVEKADGMFLWVKLVLITLEDCHSLQEWKDALDTLPEGLNEAYGRVIKCITREYSVHTQKQVLRVLQWIACSFRPLKTREVLDGILFQDATSVLNESTRLDKALLERCRPLIEERPGGVVQFVHFSAEEYFLHADSGPFVRPESAHYNIAMSCVTYLLNSIAFLDSTVSEKVFRLRVLQGFHFLQPYATDFWHAHVLEFAKSPGSFRQDFSKTLLDQLELLLRRRRLDAQDVQSYEGRNAATLQALRAQLSVLESTPSIQNAMYAFLAIHKLPLEVGASYNSREGMFCTPVPTNGMFGIARPDVPLDYQASRARGDFTGLTEAFQRYQAMVEHCLACTESSKMTPEETRLHDSFKELYGTSAFNCRQQGCPRSTDGFGTANGRSRHEDTHFRRHRCSDTTCERYGYGFANKSALQKHNGTYHSENVVSDLSQVARRTLHKQLKESIPRSSWWTNDADDQTLLAAPVTPASDLIDGKGPFFISPAQIIDLPHLSMMGKNAMFRKVKKYWQTLMGDSADLSKIDLARKELVHLSNEAKQGVQKHFESASLEMDPFLELLPCLSAKGEGMSALPPDYAVRGSDWAVAFNPRVLRSLDIACLHKIPHDSVVTCVAFSQNGKYIATGENKIARIFEALSGEESGRALLTDDLDGDTCVSTDDWDTGTFVRGVAFHPSGDFLAVGSEDKTVTVFALGENSVVKQKCHVFDGHTDAVSDLCWSQSGIWIASASADETVRVYNFLTRDCQAVFTLSDESTRVAFSPDNSYLAAGVRDGSVHIWDWPRGSLVRKVEVHDDSVYAIAFDPDGKNLVAGSLDKTSKRWSLDGENYSAEPECMTYRGHQDFVLDVAFTFDGRWLLSSSKDNNVHFWDPDSGTLECCLMGHRNSVIRLACSPVGTVFATAGGDKTLRVWRYQHYYAQAAPSIHPQTSQQPLGVSMDPKSVAAASPF